MWNLVNFIYVSICNSWIFIFQLCKLECFNGQIALEEFLRHIDMYLTGHDSLQIRYLGIITYPI